jgi:hypothetical protein
MVRRRCRQILVVDASHDPNCFLEDLGNAIRKIEIDLRVPIHFRGLEKLKPRAILGDGEAAKYAYHAIAEIEYSAADGPSESGLLLYIKPAYHGIEDAGIRSYANLNAQFPHESTSQQWFGESQFESYRALGFQIMDSVLSKGRARLPEAHHGTVAQIFDELWASSGVVERRSRGFF